MRPQYGALEAAGSVSKAVTLVVFAHVAILTTEIAEFSSWPTHLVRWYGTYEGK